jgi:hypothetical protein
MNSKLRLALMRDWHRETPQMVIDLTRYDLPAQEPPDPDPQHPVKNWSLMNVINQKGLRPQDTPVLLSQLGKADLEFVYSALPELRNRKM